MPTTSPDAVKTIVRKTYGAIATAPRSTGCCAPSCCGGTPATTTASASIGYSAAEIASVPDGADLGLGCGTPQALASLSAGERVLDLGSGAGFDAFLAARQVGPTGHVIGVDMTPEMVSRARTNAATAALPNVEFRLGEIERLPVADDSIDVVISNCVINLSPDKSAVFREAFRVLVPGGRLAIADIVAVAPLPEELHADMAAYTACVSGAALVADIRQMLADAGFTDLRITEKGASRDIVESWVPGTAVGDYVVSASIQAVKPIGVR